VLGTTSPDATEVRAAFAKLIPDVDDPNAVPYYTGKPKSLLYKNLSGAVLDRLEKEKSKPPVEVIKEVIKEVPVEKIVEVIKGDDERSLGDLLSAAFKKLFKIK